MTSSIRSARVQRKLVTRRVLASDPRLSYFLCVPEVLHPEPRLVVSIHGANRNSDLHARLLAAYAEMYGAILLAPHFSATRYGDYPKLGRVGRGQRADLALHRIIAEAVAQNGVPAARFHLFGFSAGAQFAHRYAMAYPQRVASVVIADAGRFTPPDPQRRFPRGIRSTPKLPGLRFDPAAFLRVPIRVLIGATREEDEVITLPRNIDANRGRGAARAERARQWVAAMREACGEHGVEPVVVSEELPERIRSFRSAVLRAGVAERAFESMFGPAGIVTAEP